MNNDNVVNNKEYGCKILKILLKFDKNADFNEKTNSVNAFFSEFPMSGKIGNFFLSIGNNVHLILNPRSSIENNSQEVIGMLLGHTGNYFLHTISDTKKFSDLLDGTDINDIIIRLNKFDMHVDGSIPSLSNVRVKLHRITQKIVEQNGWSYTEYYVLNEPYLSIEQIDQKTDGVFRPDAQTNIVINSKNFNNTATAVTDILSFSVDGGQYNVVKNVTLKMPEVMAYTIQACGFSRFIEYSKQCEVLEKIEDFIPTNESEALNNILQGALSGNNTSGHTIKGTDNLHIKIYIDKNDLDNYLYLSIKAKNSEYAKKNWNLHTWFTKIEQGIFNARSNGAQKSEVYFDAIEYVNKKSSIFNFKIQCTRNTLSTYVQGTNFLYLTNVLSYEENKFFTPFNTMIITPNYLQLQKNKTTDIGQLDYNLNAQTNIVNGKIFVGINGIKDIIIDKKTHIITIIARNDNIFECQYKYDDKIEDKDAKHLYDQITDIWFISYNDKERKRQKVEMNGLDAKVILPMSEAKMKEDFATLVAIPGAGAFQTSGVACDFLANLNYNNWYKLQKTGANVEYYDETKKLCSYAKNNIIRNDSSIKNIDYKAITVQYTCDEWKSKCKEEGDKCVKENLVATWAFFERHEFGIYLSDFILIEGRNSGDTSNPDLVFEFSATDLTDTKEKSIILPQYYTSTSVTVDKDVFYKMKLPADNPSGFVITTIDGTKENPIFSAYFSSLELDSSKSIIGGIILAIQIGVTVASIVSKTVQSIMKSKRELTKTEKEIFKWLDFSLDLIYAATMIYDVRDMYQTFSKAATKAATGAVLLTTKEIGKLVKGVATLSKSAFNAGLQHIQLPKKVKEILVSEIANVVNDNIENITDYLIHHPKVTESIQDIIDRWKEGLNENVTEVIKKNKKEELTDDDKDFIKNITSIMIVRAFELASNPKMLEYRLQIKSQDPEDGDYIIYKYLQNIQQFGAGYIYDSSNKKLTIDEAVFLNYIFIENALFYYVSPFQDLYATNNVKTRIIGNNAKTRIIGNNAKAEIIDVEYTKCPF